MNFYEKNGEIIFDFDVYDVESVLNKGYVEKIVTFETAKENDIVCGFYIEQCKKNLEELRKDIVQDISGLVVEDIEEKKGKYRAILNEVRILQGKKPREIKDAVKTELEQESVQTESQDGVEIGEEQETSSGDCLLGQEEE